MATAVVGELIDRNSAFDDDIEVEIVSLGEGIGDNGTVEFLGCEPGTKVAS